MSVKIRIAIDADFDQIGAIFSEENQFHANLVPEIIQVANPITTHKWYDEVVNNPDKILFVAEIGKDVVGVVLFETRTNIDDTIFTPRKFVHINDIAVAESHRDQGIGRLLMESIHKWADAHGIADVELQVWERNTQAIGFYERLGYQPWRRTMQLKIDEKGILNE